MKIWFIDKSLYQKYYEIYHSLVVIRSQSIRSLPARLIKYIVETKHMSIRTSKSKIQISNNKLIF